MASSKVMFSVRRWGGGGGGGGVIFLVAEKVENLANKSCVVVFTIGTAGIPYVHCRCSCLLMWYWSETSYQSYIHSILGTEFSSNFQEKSQRGRDF